MKKHYFLLVALFVAAFSFGQTEKAGGGTIAQWSFDDQTLNPSLGTGTISFVGGVAQSGFVTNGTGYAVSSTDYPRQGTANNTAGIEVAVSSKGYSDITIVVDVLPSAEASRIYQFQYSTDGTTWTILGNPKTVQSSQSYTTMSEKAGVTADNVDNIRFRLVAQFNDSNAGKYEGNGSNYNPQGTVLFDNIRITYGTLGVKNVSALQKAFIKNTVVDSSITFGENSEVKIYNTNGQLVKSATVKSSTPLDVSALPKGIYIVTGAINGQTVTQKVIKK